MGKMRKNLLDIIRAFRLKSIFVVILSSMSMLCIVCTVFVSIFFTQKIVKDSRENLERTNQIHLDSVVYNTDYLIEEMLHQSVVQLSYSHSILSLATAQTFGNQDINVAASDISFAAKYNTLIESVILYYPGHNCVYLSDYTKYRKEDYPQKEMLEAYENGRISGSDIKNNSKITSLFRYDGKYILAFDFPLHGEQRLATLYYVIDMTELYERIQDNALKDAPIWVYDRNNEPVFAEQADYPEEISEEWLSAAQKERTSLMCGEKPVFISTSEDLGWHYLYMADADYFTFSMAETFRLLLPVVLLVLLFAGIGSFLVTVLIYRPFKRLIFRIDGNPSSKDLEKSSKNEMAYLNLAFSNMGEQNRRLMDMMTQVAEDVTTRLFMELFMGKKVNYAEIQEMLQGINSPFKMNASYVACVMHSVENLSQNLQLRQKIQTELKNVLEEYSKKNEILYHIVYADGQTFGIVISFAEDSSVLVMKRTIVEAGEAILEHMRKNGITVLFHSGNIYHSIVDLGFSYAEAYKGMLRHPEKKVETAPKTDQEQQVGEVRVMDKEDIQLRIQHALRMVQEENEEGALELLNRVAEKGMKDCTTAEECRRYYTRFLYGLSDELVKIQTVNMAAFPPDMFSADKEALREMDGEQLLQKMKQTGEEVVQVLSRILKKNQNHFFLATKEYVRMHYSDCDLSLNAAAEAVGANPSYISRLFREILGISFTNFMTDCRMEASLELLQNRDLTIKEVAAKSGFNTIQNYMRVFKKYYGKTPGQYREELSE